MSTAACGRGTTGVASSPPVPPSTPSGPWRCLQFAGKQQLHILEMRNGILIIDSVMCFVLGTVLFVAPAFTASLIFIKRTDGVHWHLLRCIGGQKIAAAFIMYRMRNSSAEALTACYLIRILGSVLTLLILIHCSAATPGLIYSEYLRIAKYWWSGWLAANLFLQTVHRWAIGGSLIRNDFVGNILYQLDSLTSLVVGAAWLAFPKWLLHRQVSVYLDESHEICARLMGAYFLTSYVISSHAVHWKQSSDRLIAVDSRAVICATILLAQVWSQYAYGEHWNGSHWVGILLFSSWTIASVLYRCYLATQIGPKSQKAKLR